jgi:serine phosphatase RsbU (regulator of sigma subunit)
MGESMTPRTPVLPGQASSATPPAPSALPSAAVATTGDLSRVLDLELSGSLNLRRTVLRVLDLAHSRFADWAMLVLTEPRGKNVEMYGGADHAFTATSRSVTRDHLLSQVIEGGQPELLHVDLASEPHDALSGLIPHPALREQAAALMPVDVLAMPLTARGGAVGALLLVRGAGQGFDADDVGLIRQLCDRAALALDSARIYEDHARVTRVLEESLRPPTLPEVPGVEVAACFRAAATHLAIGGDFYDVHGGDDDWLVVLGDVCGKGVEAAVLNGRARQSIRTAARFDRRPGKILSTLNEVLYEDGSDRFVTVACGRLRPAGDGRFTVDLAVAGHPAPFVVRADGSVTQPEVTGRLAGALLHGDPYAEVTVEIGPDDALVLFSDGIHEAHGQDGLFGMDRLRGLLSRYAGTGASAIVEAIEREVVEHLDDNGHDDMTALAIVPRRASHRQAR